MKRFSALLERLYYEPSTLGKTKLLMDYFAATPDPDRGYAVAIIAGALSLPNFKRAMVLDLIRQRVDPELFAMSYDYVGEFSETVAHLWPTKNYAEDLPPLAAVVETLRALPKAQTPEYVASMLDRMNSPQRWAFLKVGMSSLRIGISARLLKQILAKYGGKDVQEIETIWHSLDPPYTDLFAWLENRGNLPEATDRIGFLPVMLAHPLEEPDYGRIIPDQYAAEWKYDGIRVQLVHNSIGRAMFSRTGDDIGGSFPDALKHLNFHAVLDGELIVNRNGVHGGFNDLQQRLGRKAPSAKMIADYPAGIIAYDVLSLEGEDVRTHTYENRRALLASALERYKPNGVTLSPLVDFSAFSELEAARASVHSDPTIEGLMLKRKDSPYVAGRPTGPWYKWKIDPKLVDAVLMYAQRGSGRRSSFYSDYTFGLWRDDELLPIGKAYFGFTDAELAELDKWVRHHTIQQFGPVREVDKHLVFEVAFDAVQRSKRHKSGFALRFPRINRIRWDKPAAEADHLETLARMAPGAA